MTALLPAPRLERPATTASRAVPAVPTLTVDHAAIAANTRRLAEATTGRLMAVVKADGFGLGAVEVARTALANGATWLGSTGFGEARRLRAAGTTVPILTWLHPAATDFASAVVDDIDLAVPSLAHLAEVAITAPGARVHLQVDVGLARDGAAPEQWRSLFRHAARLERDGLIGVVGLMGHLPCSDDPFHPSNADGRARFLAALQLAWRFGLRPRHRHLAATDATLSDPLSHHTMSRVGAGLVGATGGLRGAVTLTASIVETRRVRPGTPVGYGHAWEAPRETTLGLLPLGYADGLPRCAGPRAEVLVRGARRPLVGAVSMDMAVVDLGDLPAGPGESVVVLGPGDGGEPTLHEWARWAGTLPHEILTGIGPRVRRAHVDGVR